jgi:hypothetical protein
MSYDEVADKFRDCAAFAHWPRAKTEQIVALVRKIEELKDVRELTTACSQSA